MKRLAKKRIATCLAVIGRWLVRQKTPLRPLVLWLWQKTIRFFEEEAP